MPRFVRRALTLAACLAACLAAPAQARHHDHELPLPTVDTTTVAGDVAMLRLDGTAAIPLDAPRPIQRLITAANEIVGFPYVWGGGHGKLVDDGYDCSGAVSFALIRAKLLKAVRTSRTFRSWGDPGRGEWLTVWAQDGHVYLEVAGLRLEALPEDTVSWGRPHRSHHGFRARHIPGL
jgi:hypothetical protein